MEKQKIYEKLITIIGEVSEISDEKVTLESTFESLGADSLSYNENRNGF
jgi:acyl carrier protein